MWKRGEENREGDLVLIHYQDKAMAYARIEAIEPDIKKDWYQVTLLFLTIPAQTVTWILREAYIHGELFTMGGQSVRLEKVEKQKTGNRKQDILEEQQTTENPRPTLPNVKVLPFKKEK
jgi:sugar/nucleoside kinase (ribokinase family)